MFPDTSCSVIFPVHCTVSSLALFLNSIFFSWEEGQVKRSSIRFLWPTMIVRACLRRAVGALLVLWSCNPGAHTLPASIPKASAPVSVHVRGRVCLFLVMLIRVCIFLRPAAHILDRACGACSLWHPSFLQPGPLSPSSYNKGCKQALPPSLSPSNEVFCVLKFLPFLPPFSIYLSLGMLWDASGEGMRT
jgi:hypothetical protein